MRTQFVEATNGFNWGKFMIASFEADEWRREEHVTDEEHPPTVPQPLLRGRGWGPDHRLIVDLQTGEGAIFYPHAHGHAPADLDKHRIWVCPMFEPFLAWLYDHVDEIDDLPPVVEFTEAEAPSAMFGHRRTGVTS